MRFAILAGGLAMAVAAGASATECAVKLNFGSGLYSGSQSTTIKLNNIAGELTGFSLDFDFDHLQSSASWASDSAFVLNGTQYGGYDTYLSSATSFGGFWAFDGSGSSGAGHYSDLKAATGTFVYGDSYVFEFGNGWSLSGLVAYDNVTITLYGVCEVPAPGAVALLGLAGLVGRRRRA